ncbi:MAG: hypothetical protein E7264_08635 [Lachnospiraceae bacterium]|nr:hypothetical protein [Lachnospiraceae bacterium]
MATGSILFLGVAIVGLILLIVGVIFLIKNLKWKKEKDAQGISSTINIVAMILFGLMIFFGLMWFLCFGLGSLIFTFAI